MPRTGTTSRSGRSPARDGALRNVALAGVLLALFGIVLGLALSSCSGAVGAPHRSTIVGVKSEPWNQALARHAENAVIPDPDLAFSVTVANPGIVAEEDVAVTLTLDRKPEPVVLTRMVKRLEAGQAKSILFRRPRWGRLAGAGTLIVETLPRKGLRSLAAYPLSFETFTPPASGLHGTGLVGVQALPGRQSLAPGRLTTVIAATRPGFAVRVKDTGDSSETNVRVTLTVLQTPTPIVASKTIPLIERGAVKTVVFPALPGVRYASRSQVKVDVSPVAGEANRNNNTATYPVVFSLG